MGLEETCGSPGGLNEPRVEVPKAGETSEPRVEEGGAESAKEQEYKELLQRVQADFINYKRRIEQERVEQAKMASSALVLRLLPVLDDLQRASGAANAASSELGQGIGLVLKKLEGVLREEGVTKIEAMNAVFDPRFHEALTYEEEGESQEDEVCDVLQEGYTLHGRVLRPAMVRVRRGRHGG